MAPHVSENLSRIRKSASQLNALADEATEQIRALGKFLEDLSPGVEVWDVAEFHRGREKNASDVAQTAEYKLGYARDDAGRFGLVVMADVIKTTSEGVIVSDYYNNGEPEWETAWVGRLDQATRQLRIAAVARLPEFIEHLSEKMEDSVGAVKANIDKVRAASAELKAALEQPVQTAKTPRSDPKVNRFDAK